MEEDAEKIVEEPTLDLAPIVEPSSFESVQISPEEFLARFVFDKKGIKIDRVNNRVSPTLNAFQYGIKPEQGGVSVTLKDRVSPAELKSKGERIAANKVPAGRLLAAICLSVEACRNSGLRVASEPETRPELFDRFHCVITEWPQDKEKQKKVVQDIESSAGFHIVDFEVAAQS